MGGSPGRTRGGDRSPIPTALRSFPIGQAEITCIFRRGRLMTSPYTEVLYGWSAIGRKSPTKWCIFYHLNRNDVSFLTWTYDGVINPLRGRPTSEVDPPSGEPSTWHEGYLGSEGKGDSLLNIYLHIFIFIEIG